MQGGSGGLWGAQGQAGGWSLAPLRSVYLHNNQLSNAGLPPDAFHGSEAVTTLSLSNNQLSYLPPSLPPSLERLHLQVHLLHLTPTLAPPPQNPFTSVLGDPSASSEFQQLEISFSESLLLARVGHKYSLSSFAKASSSITPLLKNFLWLPAAICPDPQSHSFLASQNNLISKVPRGALSRQTHLRELYLQHNQLTDSGLDATTFRWGLR